MGLLYIYLLCLHKIGTASGLCHDFFLPYPFNFGSILQSTNCSLKFQEWHKINQLAKQSTVYIYIYIYVQYIVPGILFSIIVLSVLKSE